ncbi:MAG: hypothetical protein ABIJ56_16815 [Pseudomonadota bacterium]
MSGFGPVFSAGSSVIFTCVAGATRINTTYTNLRTNHHAGCDGSEQLFGSDCNAAIRRFCRSEGHTSGFGPVEISGDNLTAVCVDP